MTTGTKTWRKSIIWDNAYELPINKSRSLFFLLFHHGETRTYSLHVAKMPRYDFIGGFDFDTESGRIDKAGNTTEIDKLPDALTDGLPASFAEV